MKLMRSGLFALTFAVAVSGANAAVLLAPHRAVYKISLDKGEGARAPVSASGLIAYEFRGSSCDGYATNFRQVTQLQRGEGEQVAADARAVTFEDGEAKTLRFKIDSVLGGAPDQNIDGNATRQGGGIKVDLTKPAPGAHELVADILFPTQHLQKIIETARGGAGVFQAKVFDGSDTGEKIFDTLTVIGKEAGDAASADASTAADLKSVRRWPVTVSYFDASKPDNAAEYILSFDQYENGVSGSLKLDYGAFSLAAKLTEFELLPVATCK